jgi:hypothetical protein
MTIKKKWRKKEKKRKKSGREKERRISKTGPRNLMNSKFNPHQPVKTG